MNNTNKIENIKKEISKTELVLLTKHHKKIAKNLKKYIKLKQNLANFINKQN